MAAAGRQTEQIDKTGPEWDRWGDPDFIAPECAVEDCRDPAEVRQLPSYRLTLCRVHWLRALIEHGKRAAVAS